MNLLLLTHYYPPEGGAAQHRWSTLVGHLVSEGDTVRVVTPAPHYPLGHLLPGHENLRPGTTHEGPHGETVHRVSFRPYDSSVRSRMLDEATVARDAVRTVRRGFGGWRPDVVVATVPSLPMAWAGARSARMFGVPFVLDLRDAWPDLIFFAQEWDLPTSRVRTRARAAVRVALNGVGSALTRQQRRADAVVATTESFAEVLRSRSVGSVHVVRNAAHEVPGYAQHVVHRESGPLHVLYAGTLGRAHGLGTAVRAAALARERGVEVRLRFLGAGADLGHLRRLAEELRAPVEFLDPVPRRLMGPHYAWADTALVSLRPWEALELAVPSKLYELMGLGLHVSAVVSGEAGQIVEQTGAGTLTAPGDVDQLARSWASLHADRRLLDVSDRARDWAREHADATRLGDAYRTLLQSMRARV
ncbi:glycosyltransferase family 4 protein [Knoellia sp. CPCC 206450]|uniref:glycosyltransferase family 4 protein n=1 Tax=Knoellia tibetensis TaxID=3404798 RepID=UPI003B433F94